VLVVVVGVLAVGRLAFAMVYQRNRGSAAGDKSDPNMGYIEMEDKTQGVRSDKAPTEI
jgi:hypothetical protein